MIYNILINAKMVVIINNVNVLNITHDVSGNQKKHKYLFFHKL